MVPSYQIPASLPVTLWTVTDGCPQCSETLEVSWMRVALRSPTRTWEVVPLKSVWDLSAMGRRWAGERHQLLLLEEHLSQAFRGTLYQTKVRLAVVVVKPFQKFIHPYAFTLLHFRAV